MNAIIQILRARRLAIRRSVRLLLAGAVALGLTAPAFAEPPLEKKRTGIGWAIDPDAFRDTLLALHHRFHLPIFVTENGFGAREQPNQAGQIGDEQRVEYLRSYTDAMRSAMQAGARVCGYFVWSLLDNFEWNSGYVARFGLVYVDYATQQRVPKSSFGWYAQLIRQSAQSA